MLAPWLGQGATAFNPSEYTLSDLSRQVSADLTVVTRSTGMSCTEFMNFACKFKSVVATVWTPQGIPMGGGWIRYHSAEDAQKCFGELRDKGYIVAITTVSVPFNRRSQCLSGIQEVFQLPNHV